MLASARPRPLGNGPWTVWEPSVGPPGGGSENGPEGRKSTTAHLAGSSQWQILSSDGKSVRHRRHCLTAEPRSCGLIGWAMGPSNRLRHTN